MTNQNKIEIVEGDDYSAKINISGLTVDQIISDITFLCPGLGLSKTISEDDNGFNLVLVPSDTNGKSGLHTYSLIANVGSGADAKHKTIVYKNTLRVLPKEVVPS